MSDRLYRLCTGEPNTYKPLQKNRVYRQSELSVHHCIILRKTGATFSVLFPVRRVLPVRHAPPCLCPSRSFFRRC